jgi:hypothetical protein
VDQKFEKQTKELKEFAEEQTGQLARIIAVTIANPMREGFKSLSQKLAINTGRIEKLENNVVNIKSALHLS